jgi:hypothetical protein
MRRAAAAALGEGELKQCGWVRTQEPNQGGRVRGGASNANRVSALSRDICSRTVSFPLEPIPKPTSSQSSELMPTQTRAFLPSPGPSLKGRGVLG